MEDSRRLCKQDQLNPSCKDKKKCVHTCVCRKYLGNRYEVLVSSVFAISSRSKGVFFRKAVHKGFAIYVFNNEKCFRRAFLLLIKLVKNSGLLAVVRPGKFNKIQIDKTLGRVLEIMERTRKRLLIPFGDVKIYWINVAANFSSREGQTSFNKVKCTLPVLVVRVLLIHAWRWPQLS